MSFFHKFATWGYVVFQVLALISTFVSFGAELIDESDPGGSTASWKWNEVDFVYVFFPGADGQAVTHKYDSGSDDPRLAGCMGGGQGLVALAVLSLLVFVLVSLPLGVLRALGREHAFPKLGADARKYTTVELGTAVWHAFSFFCQCVIWGGTCFRLVKQDDPNAGATVKATGFAYVGFCCALMILNLGLMWYLRREKLADTTGAGTTSPTAAAGTENRAAFASVYNAASQQEGAAASAAAPAAGGYGAEPAQPVASQSAGATGATAGGGYQTF